MKKVTERANDLTYTGAMGFKGEMNNAGSYTHYVFGRYSNKVYVYNSKAIQAVIPFERFVIPK